MHPACFETMMLFSTLSYGVEEALVELELISFSSVAIESLKLKSGI